MASDVLRFPSTLAGRQRYISEMRSIYSGVATEVYDPDYALSLDEAIYSKMLRDPIIAHALYQRLHSVAGTEWHCEPVSDSPEDKAGGSVMEELVENIKKFSQVRFNLAWFIAKGRTYGYLAGRRQLLSIDAKAPRVWWVPKTVKDIDKRRMRYVPDRDTRGKQNLEFWSIKQDEWIPVGRAARTNLTECVYQDREEKLGQGEGLFGPLYHFFYAKGIIWREYLQGIK